MALRLPLDRRVLVRACAVALGMRLLCVLLYAYRTDTGDARYYNVVAHNILEHHTHSSADAPPFAPTLYRAPLYPAFVAAIRFVFGENILAVQLVQCVLGALAVVLLALAAARVSKRLGLIALWLLAVTPYDAAYAGALLSEALVIFFLSGALASALVLRSPRRWALTGLFLGLATLTRDVHLLLIPSLAAFVTLFGLRRRPWRERVLAPAAMLLAAALVIAPWTVRNNVVMHQNVTVSRSVFARALWYGTWTRNYDRLIADFNGREYVYPPYAFKVDGERELFERWDRATDQEVERDRVFLGMFKRRIAADPGGTIYSWLRRVPLLWAGTSRLDIFNFRPAFLAHGRPLHILLKLGLYGLNLSLCLAGWTGILFAVRRWRVPLFWFALPIVYTSAVLAPLDAAEPRYTQCVYGCLLVMVAYTIRLAHVTWVRRRRRRLL